MNVITSVGSIDVTEQVWLCTYDTLPTGLRTIASILATASVYTVTHIVLRSDLSVLCITLGSDTVYYDAYEVPWELVTDVSSLVSYLAPMEYVGGYSGYVTFVYPHIHLYARYLLSNL